MANDGSPGHNGHNGTNGHALAVSSIEVDTRELALAQATLLVKDLVGIISEQGGWLSHDHQERLADARRWLASR